MRTRAPRRLRDRKARARAACGRTPGLHSSPSMPRCLAPPRKPPAFGPLPAPPESGSTLAQLTLPAKPPGFKPHTWRGGGRWGGWWLAPWPGASYSSGLCSWVPGSIGHDAKSIHLQSWGEQGGSSYPDSIQSRARHTERLMKSFLYCHPALPREEPGMLLGPQFSRCLVPANCGRVCLSLAGAALAGHIHTLPQHPGRSSSSARGLRIREFVVCEAQFLGKIVSPLHPYPGLPASRPGIPSKSRRAAHCTVPPCRQAGGQGDFQRAASSGRCVPMPKPPLPVCSCPAGFTAGPMPAAVVVEVALGRTKNFPTTFPVPEDTPAPAAASWLQGPPSDFSGAGRLRDRPASVD